MLIDGDNAQSSLLAQMLVEAGRHGQVTVRRIYGDWTTNNMKSWKDTLNYHAFQPIQQFRYTVGKNATDSAMIIDAMDNFPTRTFERRQVAGRQRQCRQVAERCGDVAFEMHLRELPRRVDGVNPIQQDAVLHKLDRIVEGR